MEITRFADLKPRIVRDILDDAFDLYREKFALLAGVSAVAYVPVMLTALAILIGPFADFVKSSTRNGTSSGDTSFALFLQFVGVSLLSFPLIAIAQIMQTGATCIVVEDRFRGRPTTIGSAWRRMLQHIGPLIAVALVTGLLTLFLGSVLSGIGAYIGLTMTLYSAQIIILEKQGARESLRRSWAMASRSFGKSLGFVLLTGIIGTFLWIGLSVLMIGLILLAAPPQDAGPASGGEATLFTLIFCILGISLLLVAPINGIGATLLYYDLRVRREGIDIEAAAEDMGYALAPDPFGDARIQPTSPRRRGKGRASP